MEMDGMLLEYILWFGRKILEYPRLGLFLRRLYFFLAHFASIFQVSDWLLQLAAGNDAELVKLKQYQRSLASSKNFYGKSRTFFRDKLFHFY